MRRLALPLALLVALATGSMIPADAQFTPVPRPPTSALGTGETLAEACQEALENLRDRCPVLGNVFYSDTLCTYVDPPGPLEPVRLCSCVANTIFCPNFFPL